MNDTETKVCRKCHLEFPITEFSFATAEHLTRRGDCKKCAAARVAAYYAANAKYRAASKARAAAQGPKTPWKSRVDSLKFKYGITHEQYEEMEKAQDHKCALCRSPEIGRTGKSGKWKAGFWNVDHCHKTGKVRGLLCHTCNVRLGSYEKLMEQIGAQRVIAYLI